MSLLGIRDPLVLSPMVDVTDAAFRSLAREWGADITCSEMVAAVGLVHDHPKAWRDVAPWPGEAPYGVQFMGGDPAEMAAAVHHLAEAGPSLPDFVDINLGCPAPNILRSCAGGFLLRDPPQAGRVIAAAKEAATEVGIPHVTAKLRLGPSATRHTYLEVGAEAEAAGASWVTLHARTVEQGYSGTADWSHIGRLVAALGIPVVGNGDLRTPADVVRMRDTTGCAGFFIARAAMHDPTVFARMRHALDAGDASEALAEPDLAARMASLARYLERAPAAGVDRIGDLRRQATRFVAGAPGARQLRVRFQAAPDAAAIQALVREVAAAPPAG